MRRQLGMVCAALVSSTRHTLGAALVVTVLAQASVAHGEVKSVKPYFVVVTKNGTLMKCSDAAHLYNVRALNAGEVLRIDGESGPWLRAEYPTGTPAFVPAADGKLDADGKTVRLARNSSLMAFNINGTRPFWPLLERDLPAGTTFVNAVVVRAADGAVEGYQVPAPAPARGYVRKEVIRAATAEEANTYSGPSGPAKDAVPAAQPTSTTPSPNPQTSASQSGSPKPVATNGGGGGGGGAGVGANPLPAVNPPPANPITMDNSFKPVEGAGDGGGGGKRVTTTTTTTPGVRTVTPAAPKPEMTKRISDLQTLRSLFERSQKSDIDENELSTVIGEFERSLAGFGSSTPSDLRIREELNKRLEAMRLRRDIAQARKKSQGDALSLDQRVQSIKVALSEVEKLAVYTIVGTMLPSTVYDGKRGLPLMWRIESADITSTRTIGYVVPREGLDFISKTGRVVGIVGDSKLDPALGVNIVSPIRVDVLSYVEGRYQVESSQSALPSSGASPVPATPTSSSAPVVPTSSTPASTAPASSTSAPDAATPPEGQPAGKPSGIEVEPK